MRTTMATAVVIYFAMLICIGYALSETNKLLRENAILKERLQVYERASYTLDATDEGIILKDGYRVVAVLDSAQIGQLYSVILKDNE